MAISSAPLYFAQVDHVAQHSLELGRVVGQSGREGELAEIGLVVDIVEVDPHKGETLRQSLRDVDHLLQAPRPRRLAQVLLAGHGPLGMMVPVGVVDHACKLMCALHAVAEGRATVHIAVETVEFVVGERAVG